MNGYTDPIPVGSPYTVEPIVRVCETCGSVVLDRHPDLLRHQARCDALSALL